MNSINVIDLFQKNKNYQKLEKALDKINKDTNNRNIYCEDSSSIVSKLSCASLFVKKKQTMIYITPSLYDATKAFEVFTDILGADFVSFFPVEAFMKSELVASSGAFRLARMLTYYNILNETPQVIVTNAMALVRPVMSQKRLLESVKKYQVNEEVEPTTVALDLVCRGYKKEGITQNPGTFSVRGSVIDVYPINEDDPIRITFFDNEIESIKRINLETQMSKEHLDSCVVFPLYDINYSSQEKDEIVKQLTKLYPNSEKVKKDIIKIQNYDSLDQMSIYLPQIDSNYQYLLDLIKNAFCFYEENNQIQKQIAQEAKDQTEYLQQEKIKLSLDSNQQLFEGFYKNYQNVFFSANKESLSNVFLKELIDFQTVACFDYNNQLRQMVADIKANPQKTFLVTHLDEQKLSFIEEVFTQNSINYQKIENTDGISDKKVNLAVSTNAYGYCDLATNFEILSPNEFASGKTMKNSRFQKYYKQSTKIYNKEDLSFGDYVVHQDYGIGCYRGIVTKTIRGVQNDYLCLEYANQSILYIPVENIYVLEKYVGSKDTKPKLNNINGKEWAKKKERVKQKVKDIAQKLLQVQAKRDAMQGFIYAKDSKEQMEFESDFAYNETVGQMAAIDAVKKDMEGTHPMDRLICGDVGFGKTEVAMRAAFKACDNGKQVAYLAPTTVLTRQHYYSFLDRFEKYGMRVELLNRFTPPDRVKLILKGLKEGFVDIVIGTHRLLSNDIIFKDLGLLIVDEEQRFGVEHKEKIKQMKASVDVLTLTATPIPRTLQMALSGLRDLSLIETAPTNRLPIQTYVLEANDAVIKDAIEKELARNGQVFYLLNRIGELDRISLKIHRLIPFAKVGIIHGRMDKDAIEDELTKFLDHQYDVLVCTTIIETGIDIPNANTLIIEKADILGLSQLYQIRGRVGRSDRISYAYLMYESGHIVTEDAIKRLDAIKEFTALGSGYKIAMRDLAIRGAGDILGSEQAGFIDDVGLDLYMKLLNDAVQEAKGAKPVDEKVQKFNITSPHHVDKDYVGDEAIRIEVHEQINEIRSRDQLEALKQEYTDRYGKIPEDILLYMETKYLEYLMKEKGIEAYREKEDEVVLNFSVVATSRISSASIYELSLKYAPKIIFAYQKERIFMTLKLKDYPKGISYTLTKFLEKVVLK